MNLHHRKAVIVLGLARGGTNIVWNILQSHPQLGSTIGEMGAVINPTSSHHFRNLLNRALGQAVVRVSPLRQWVGQWIDARCYQDRMQAIDDVYARYKNETEQYTRAELEQTILCTKGTNQDMYLIDLLEMLYDETYVIVVTRDGYAVAESWLRRGHRVQKNARLYAHYMTFLHDRVQARPNWMQIKFEDVLRTPFACAGQMFEFAQLDPPALDKLRLKVKKVVNAQGERITYFGDPGGKHWFSRDTIHDLLNPAQSTVQFDRLTAADKTLIAAEIDGVMARLGY